MIVIVRVPINAVAAVGDVYVVATGEVPVTANELDAKLEASPPPRWLKVTVPVNPFNGRIST